MAVRNCVITYVHKAILIPEISEILHCEQAVIMRVYMVLAYVMEDDTTVGHVLYKKSGVVWYFSKHNEIVNCQITARRKHGKGLEGLQGFFQVFG